MARDKVLPTRNCFCAFVKRDIRSLADDFFLTVRDRDCTRDVYTTNYDKPIDDNLKKVAMKYAPDKDILLISPLQTNSESKSFFFLKTSFPQNIRQQYSRTIFGRNIWQQLYILNVVFVILNSQEKDTT